MDEITSQQATLYEMTSQQAALDEMTSQQATLDEITSPQATLDEMTSQQATLDEMTSPQDTLNEMTSQQATLDEMTSQQATHEMTSFRDFTTAAITTTDSEPMIHRPNIHVKTDEHPAQSPKRGRSPTNIDGSRTRREVVRPGTEIPTDFPAPKGRLEVETNDINSSKTAGEPIRTGH